MSEEWFNLLMKELRPNKRHWQLWVKFYWYKYIRRLDIAGFYAGVPIIRTNYLEQDLQNRNSHPE